MGMQMNYQKTMELADTLFTQVGKNRQCGRKYENFKTGTFYFRHKIKQLKIRVFENMPILAEILYFHHERKFQKI